MLYQYMANAAKRGDEIHGLAYSGAIAVLEWVLGIGPPPPLPIPKKGSQP